jgi:hypothetical protein
MQTAQRTMVSTSIRIHVAHRVKILFAKSSLPLHGPEDGESVGLRMIIKHHLDSEGELLLVHLVDRLGLGFLQLCRVNNG